MASAAVDKSVDELKHEITELYRQQREINERLNNPRGRRGGRGGFLRPIGGRGGRGRIRKADADLEGQPPKKKLLSAVVKVNGNEEKRELAEAETGIQAEDEQDTSLASQHGRRDNRREAGFTGHETRGEPVPRVLPKVDDPKLAKRNRRMFGALLGTLEKFRQEDRELSTSEAYMRRSDSLKRAEQRAQEESEKLRQQERETFTERRKRDLILRARVSAKAEAKHLELLFIQWAENESRLSSFLKTKAEPGIFYKPVKQTERDKKLLEERRREFEEWKVKRREELDEYQKQVSETYLAKAEAEIERLLAGRNRRKGQQENKDNAEEAMDEPGNAADENKHEDTHDQGQEEEGDALVADVMEEEDDYRPEDDTTELAVPQPQLLPHEDQDSE